MNFSFDFNIINSLRCPHCKQSLSLVEKGCASLVCEGPKKHCFDISSSGYVNFASPSQSGGGDSAEAVKAREEFLSLGLYSPLREAVYRMAIKHGGTGLLVDAGCGEGYYSQRMSESFCVFGADISKSAVNTASKRAKRERAQGVFYSVASVFELPVKDGAASVVTNIFAPCAESEYDRILANDGALIVVYAGEDHLLGLKKAMYDTVHKNSERADMPARMELVEEQRVCFDISLEGADNIKRLFAMTPYYWRTSDADAQKLYSLERVDTEVDFIIAVYKKRKEEGLL